MTTEELRDHFAGLALAGLLTQHDGSDLGSGNPCCWAKEQFPDVASDAYLIADAMLKAREMQVDDANARIIAAAPDLLENMQIVARWNAAKADAQKKSSCIPMTNGPRTQETPK